MRPKLYVLGVVSALALLACASVPGPEFSDEEDGEKSSALQQPGQAPAAVAAAGPRCGDRVCSAEESCSVCPQDCGACKCVEAPACGPAVQAPSNAPAVPQLNVKFEWKSHAKIVAELQQIIAAATPEARSLAAALSTTALVDESPTVTRMRAIFAQHPAVADRLRARLSSVGMPSTDTYRGQFPEMPPRKWATTMGGPIDCGPPQLTIRATKIKVDEEDDDFANDIVYCSISSDSAKGSEIRVTPRTPALDEGDSYDYPMGQATFWGQQGPREAGGDLTIKYDCYEADTNDGYNNLLRVLATEGVRMGRTLDDSGWVSDTAGAAVRLLPLIMALDTDDHLFEATQVIPVAEQLNLTRGGSWTVRKEGTHNFSDWDWTLHMQAWGCAVNGCGTAPPPQDAGPG